MATVNKTDAIVDERKGDSSSGGSSGVDIPAQTAGRDLDQAYWYVQESGSHQDEEATPNQLKALRRKIDWRIVPIMFLCYTMQFIDKVSLNVSPQSTSYNRNTRLMNRVVCCCNEPQQRS
jgi:hypothetical protein